jgi:hypothetical protein
MARSLDLDFQRGPQRLHWSSVVLIVTGALCLGIVARMHFSLTDKIAVFEHRIDAAGRTLKRQAPTPEAAMDPATRGEQTREADDILGLLSLPWQSALLQIEDVGRPDIALLGVEPDLQKGVIHLSGEARTYEAILAYMKQLQSRPGLTEVLLQSHQRDEQRPGQPTRFLITARWKASE